MHRREAGLCNPDSHSHHAQRRHHPSGSRPDRLYHRGADRSGPFSGPAAAIYPPVSRAALPVPPDERRHRQGLHPGGPCRPFHPAVRLLLPKCRTPAPWPRSSAKKSCRMCDKKLHEIRRACFEQEYVQQGRSERTVVFGTRRWSIGWEMLERPAPASELDRDRRQNAGSALSSIKSAAAGR